MDTIVIPDPLLKIADFGETLTPKDRLYLTAKHALNALAYKELALAEVEPPIVVVVGDALRSNGPKLHELMSLAELDLLSHLGRVFDLSFEDGDDLKSFLAQFESIEQLAAAVRDGSRVLFDLDWPSEPLEQIRRHLKDTGARFNKEAKSWMYDRQPGPLVADLLKGRLMQVNDIITSSTRLDGTPIVDAPTSWQYLIWKYEYDIDRGALQPATTANLLTLRALQSVNNDDRLRVLRASPEVLIDLRRNGALADLRELLRAGMRDITLASVSDLEGVTSEIASAVGSAMCDHQKKLDELVAAGIRWYGLKLAPMVVSATISIIGAATGDAAMATVGAVTNVLGLPSVKDVVKDAKSIITEHGRLRRSATGILFRNL